MVNKWKEEYNQIKMTTMQKNKLKQSLTVKRQERSFVPIILPLFIVVGLFLFGLSQQQNGLTTANENQSLTSHEAISLQLIVTFVGGIILVMIAYMMLIAISRKPGRLVQYKVFRYFHQQMEQKKPWLLIVLPLIVLLIVSMLTFSSARSIELLEWIILLFIFVDVALLLFMLTKNNTRACCANCDVEFTVKEILIAKQCTICGEKKVRDPKNSSNHINFLVMLILITVMSLTSWTPLPLWGIAIFVVGFLFFSIFTISPYVEKYQKDTGVDPPLW